MEHILRINCKDEKGLVFKISALLYNKGNRCTTPFFCRKSIKVDLV